MPLKIKKHWENLDSFTCDVLDKFGEPFAHGGKQWKMVLRAPSSDKVQAALKENAAEEAAWRMRQPPAKKQAPLPTEMSVAQLQRLIAASHVKWIDAPLEDEADVDFESEDFITFLEEEPWYLSQWQSAWLDAKNSARLLTKEKPKKTSSTGVKPS